ncbi:457_t:CDS:1, partial [Cetraspora pellucida]
KMDTCQPPSIKHSNEDSKKEQILQIKKGTPVQKGSKEKEKPIKHAAEA